MHTNVIRSKKGTIDGVRSDGGQRDRPRKCALVKPSTLNAYRNEFDAVGCVSLLQWNFLLHLRGLSFRYNLTNRHVSSIMEEYGRMRNGGS
jgi:hypothetical protein